MLFKAALSLALLLCCSGQTLTAGAQGGEKSFPEILQEIEQSLSLPAQENLPLLLRTERLENTVFGSPQTGSIVSRIGVLKRFVDERRGASSKDQLTPAAQGGTGQEAPPPADKPAYTPPVDQAQPLSQPTVPAPYQNQGFTPLPLPTTSAPLAAETLTEERIARVKELLQTAQLPRIIPTENTTPPHFFRILPPSQTEPVTSDYLENVLAASKNRTFRFAAMPITVYITPIQDQSLMKAVREGFFDWESRGARVKFAETTNMAGARIKVIWSRLGVSSDINDCTLGAHTITKWTKRPSGKLAVIPISAIPVPIYIPSLGPKYTVPPQVIEVNLDLIYSKVPEARYLLTKNIIAHELGHAMGLLGHSPEKGDLMYAITDEHSRLSQRDLNTLERLYARKVDVPL
ncbi:MAG: matrixin family metalloprotease [Candidatus Obscuribacter sp.]|nr:matrixin family metalloprotease [Candidatus Obscuribacter sp.]MBK9279562.1 matrixin family metalloprotease [Candidatus Obscuribacter sp.]